MNVQQQARKRWDSIAKPLHSLGLLEDLVVRIAGTQEAGERGIGFNYQRSLTT